MKPTRPGSRLTRRQLLGFTVPAVLGKFPANLAAAPSQFQQKSQQRASEIFEFPSIGMKIKSQAMLLAIDDYLLPLKRNLCYYLSKPEVRKEPVVAPSRDNPAAPDLASGDLYGAVLLDEGKFRLWYLGGYRGPAAEERLGVVYVCYAESEDGIRWTKPNLGQVMIEGSRNNNAIAIPEPDREGVVAIKDKDDPNPQRHYKMIYQRRHEDKYWTIRTATSPNGKDHWSFGAELPVASFIEFSSFYKHDGLYILNAQTVSPFWRSEGGHNLGRQGVAWVSPDFDHWLQEAAEAFFLPEPPKPQDRGGNKPYDQVHLGVGAASFGNVLVGLYCIWHEGGNPERGFSFGKTSGDFGLVVSHDGLHFREPVKGGVYLAAEESPATFTQSGSYPTILCQGNGILNVGDETRLYHGRWLNLPSRSDWYGEIALATLPRDRWGALGLFPGQLEGTVWSAPIRFPEDRCEIALNADGAKAMRVEISDERFNLHSAYSGAGSGITQTDGGLDCPVKWKRDLQSLSGNIVRLRIHVERQERSPNPRLYAVYLRTKLT